MFRNEGNPPRGYRIIMLNSAEPELFLLMNVELPTINCWHFNIYKQENSILGLPEPEKCCISLYFLLLSI